MSSVSLAGILAIVAVVALLTILRRKNRPGHDAPKMILKSRDKETGREAGK